MEIKICKKCNIEKNIEEFSWRIKAKNRRQSYCKTCCTKLRLDIYYKNPMAHREKDAIRNAILQNFVYSFLANSNGCVDCGEKDVVCLDFDHIDPKTKKKNVADMLSLGYKLETIKSEIEKCVIRCANCHRRRTARDLNWARQKFNLVG